MMEEGQDESVPTNSSTEARETTPLFQHWDTGLIRPDIPEKLAGCESYEGLFFLVKSGDDQYAPLIEQLAQTFTKLPMQNEVGETKLFRPDSKEIMALIPDVLRGKIPWDRLEALLKASPIGELFKNELYPKHSISEAICYGVDIKQRSRPTPGFDLVLDRFHAKNQGNRIQVAGDGKFVISQGKVLVDVSPKTPNVHNS